MRGARSAGSDGVSSCGAAVGDGQSWTATKNRVHASGLGDCGAAYGFGHGYGGRLVQCHARPEVRSRSVPHREGSYGEFCRKDIFLCGYGGGVSMALGSWLLALGSWLLALGS